MILIEIGFVLLAYLLGSIPIALLVSKLFFQIDIRNHGSKNMGATNALRVMGVPYAVIVFVLDAIKAGLLVFLFTYNVLDRSLIPHLHPLYLGLFAILGHIFPIFVKFKGGKGVACTTGVILAANPICFFAFIMVFLLVVVFTKYVSAGSITATAIVFFLSFFIPPLNQAGPDLYFSLFTGIMLIIIIITHYQNIVRLIKGTEAKTTKAILKRKNLDDDENKK